MFDVMEVLASSLSATRTRVNTIASNIANAETTRTPEGGPYKRKDVVQVATTSQSKFASALDKATLSKPSILAVVEDKQDPRKVFQPGHPDADKDGFVSYPNINMVSTMTDMVSASRMYQANVTAMETVRRMIDDAQRISIRF
jgi:flagellar basal-body rod protein FlgC